MTWRSVSRTEWLSAALVTIVSLASTLLLKLHAAAVDDATDQRHVRLERLAEFSRTTSTPRPDAANDLSDLFAGRVLAPEAAPWGAFLALHTSTSAGVKR